MNKKEVPIPPHFNPDNVDRIWKVPYQDRAKEAQIWANCHHIKPAAKDTFRICLLLVDVQNTFCIPGFELYVGGRSGKGAVDDSRRLCRFIYRNLNRITRISPTMDTHLAMQIFHSMMLVNDQGEHPEPFTLISVHDIEAGKWRFNPEAALGLGMDPDNAQHYLRHYTRTLSAGGKYELTIWPYHAILGGIGHALVSAVEEAVFFHSVARYSRPDFQVKGKHPLTENYSVLKPEVLQDQAGISIAEKNDDFIQKLFGFDAVIIAGQAKSHCVAWTVDDLLNEIKDSNKDLAQKVYLLEDCTSPVVVPGVVDYTDQADAAFERFSRAGMHICRSMDLIENWPGISL